MAFLSQLDNVIAARVPTGAEPNTTSDGAAAAAINYQNSSLSSPAPTKVPSLDTQNITSTTASEGINSQKSESGVSGGAAAGVAIGCLIAGAVLASLLLTIFFKKRHRSNVQSMQESWNAERTAFENAENTKALYYLPTAPHDAHTHNELQAAKQKIKQLEQERTAASQFGNTLDRHSEQELLTSATFGLNVYDQTLKQFVMALTVNATARGQMGNSSAIGLTLCSPEQITFLRSKGAAFAKENFEDVLLHLINGVVHDKACSPFSPYVKTSEDHLLDSLHRRLQGKLDQAIVARWRCLTHLATRTGKSNQETLGEVLLADLSELCAQLLVWSGMDDVQSAKRNVQHNRGRLQSAVNVVLSLLRVIHEEMSSSNYELYMAKQPSLTKTFGIKAQIGRQSDARIIAEVVTA